MHRLAGFFALAAILTVALSAQGRASRNSAGQIVIVFKDGHRQTLSLNDVARIEFPGSAVVRLQFGTRERSAPEKRSWLHPTNPQRTSSHRDPTS